MLCASTPLCTFMCKRSIKALKRSLAVLCRVYAVVVHCYYYAICHTIDQSMNAHSVPLRCIGRVYASDYTVSTYSANYRTTTTNAFSVRGKLMFLLTMYTLHVYTNTSHMNVYRFVCLLYSFQPKSPAAVIMNTQQQQQQQQQRQRQRLARDQPVSQSTTHTRTHSDRTYAIIGATSDDRRTRQATTVPYVCTSTYVCLPLHMNARTLKRLSH